MATSIVNFSFPDSVYVNQNTDFNAIYSVAAGLGFAPAYDLIVPSNVTITIDGDPNPYSIWNGSNWNIPNYPTYGSPIPTNLSLPNGSKLYHIVIPYSSYGITQPPLTTTYRIYVDVGPNSITAGIPTTNIISRSMFLLGNNATYEPGIDPIYSPINTQSIPLVRYTFEKTHAPYIGSSNPTGPSYPINYTNKLVIAPFQTVANLNFIDPLNKAMRYVSHNVVTTNFTGSPATTFNLINQPIYQELQLSMNQTNITGNNSTGTTIEFNYRIYVDYYDFNTTNYVINPVDPQDSLTLPNTASVYTGNTLVSSDTDTIRVSPSTIDKSSQFWDIVNNQPLTGTNPIECRYVKNTLRFYVSDYFSYTNTTLYDDISAGQLFIDNTANVVGSFAKPFQRSVISLAADGISNGTILISPTFITPISNCSAIQVSALPSWTSSDGTLNSQNIAPSIETFLYNVPLIEFPFYKLTRNRISIPGTYRGFVYNLQVSSPSSPNPIQPNETNPPNPTPTFVTIEYYTRVQARYLHPAVAAVPNNFVEIQGRIRNTAASLGNSISPLNGALQITNASDVATILNFDSVSVTKEIYALNDVVQSGITNVNPDDKITYRVEMFLPSGNLSNLIFTDYLPGPVLRVDSLTTTLSSYSPPPFPANSVMYGPNQFPLGTGPINTPLVTIDTINNSFTINFGRIESNIDTSMMVDLLFTFIISNQPFVNGLIFTNQARLQIENNISETNDVNSTPGLTLNEPELQIKKFISDINNPTNPDYSIGYSPENDAPPFYGADTIIPTIPTPLTLSDFFNYSSQPAINIMGNTVARYVVAIANVGEHFANRIIAVDQFDASNIASVILRGAYNNGMQLSPSDYTFIQTGSSFITLDITFGTTTGILLPGQFIYFIYDVYFIDPLPLCYTQNNSVDLTKYSNGPDNNFVTALGSRITYFSTTSALAATIENSFENFVITPTANIINQCDRTLTIGQRLDFDLYLYVPKGILNNVAIILSNSQPFRYTLLPFVTPDGSTVSISETLTNIFTANIGNITSTINTPNRYIAQFSLKIPNNPNIVNGNNYQIVSQTGSDTCYGTNLFNFCISEPQLTITKTHEKISYDRLKYTIVIQNNSQNDAYVSFFLDTLPAGFLNWDITTVNTTYSGTYTDTSTNTEIYLSFGTITIGSSFIITFEGVMDPTFFIIGTTLLNTADIFWASLPYDISIPDDVNPDIRFYSATALDTYSYGVPDICSSVVNITDTHPEVFFDIPVAAIGDILRYTITISLPTGILKAKKFKLYLSMQNATDISNVLSLTSGTTNIPIPSSTNLNYLPGQPLAIEPDAIVLTFTDNIVNTGNNTETYSISFDLRLNNYLENQYGLIFSSPLISLEYLNTVVNVTDIACLPSVAIVEPELNIVKTLLDYVSVGIRKLSYNLTVTASTGTFVSSGYQIRIEDNNLSDINKFSSVTVSGPGIIFITQNNITIFLDSMLPGDSLTYIVDAFFSNNFPNIVETFQNTGTVVYNSQSANVANSAIYGRNGSQKQVGPLNHYYSESSINTEIRPFNLLKTSNLQNALVKDTIEYTATFSIPSGNYTNLRLVDTLDSNFTMTNLQILSSDLGLASFNYDTINKIITFDFGSVNFPIDSDPDNNTFSIKYSLFLDSKNNNDSLNTNTINLLVNDLQIATAKCDVTVVEPNLYLDKSVESSGPYSTGQLVTYEINIGHTNLSSADAYSLIVTDTPPNSAVIEEINIFASSPQTNTTFISPLPSPNLQVNFDILPQNSIIKITYKARMQTDTSGPQINTATLNYSNLRAFTYPEISDSEIIIIGDPVPKVSKIPDDYTYSPGDIITWRIEYTNTGTSPGYLPVLTETIPNEWIPDITVLSVNWTNLGNGQYQYNDTVLLVRPGETYEAFFIFKISEITTLTSLLNTVQLNFTGVDQISTDLETITSYDVPNIILSKVLTNGPLRLGHTAIYDITLKNIGTLATTINGVIIDPLPSMINLFLVNAADSVIPVNNIFLAPNETYTYSISTIVSSDTGSGTNVVSGTLDYNNGSFPVSASATDPIVKPNLVVKKEVLSPNSIIAGSIITYRLTVEHDSTSTYAANQVNIFDDIPFGQIDLNTVSIITLPDLFNYINNSNTSNINITIPNLPLDYSMIIEYRVRTNNTLYGDLENIANINWSTDTSPTTIYTNQTSCTSNIGDPIPKISKTPDNYTVRLNDIITWTINYENIGYSIGYNSVIVEDITAYPWLEFIQTGGWVQVSPGIYSNSVGDLLPNQEGFVLFQTKIIGPIPQNTNSIENTAVLFMSPLGGDPLSLSSSSGVTLNVETFSSTNFTKVLFSGNPVYGENISYQICTTNNGTVQLNPPLTVVDNLPTGTTFIPGLSTVNNAPLLNYTLTGQQLSYDITTSPLNPGESICSIITVNIQNSAQSPLFNTANLFNSTSNVIGSAQTSDNIRDPVLYINKSIITENPVAGGIVSYRIEVGHEANSTFNAYNLSIVDTPPTSVVLNEGPVVTFVPPDSLEPLVVNTSTTFLSVQFPDLPVGVTMYIDYKMELPITASGDIINTATLTYNRPNDPTIITRTDVEIFRLDNHSMEITKKVNNKTFKIGDIVEWQLEYTNNGNVTETNVYLQEVSLPQWMSFVPELNTGWILQGNVYRYNIGNLLPGVSNTVNYYVQINGPIPENVTTYQNIVNLISDVLSLSDNEIILYRPEPKLKITKKILKYNIKCKIAIFEFLIVNEGSDRVTGNYKLIDYVQYNNFRPDYEYHQEWIYNILEGTAISELNNINLNPGDYIIKQLRLNIIGCNSRFINRTIITDNNGKLLASDIISHRNELKNICSNTNF